MMHQPPSLFAKSTRCHYCDSQTLAPHKNTQGHLLLRTKDHVIPRSKLGKGVPGVTVTACRRCNSAKSDHDYEEFRLFALACLKGRKPRPDVATTVLMFEAWLAGRVLA